MCPLLCYVSTATSSVPGSKPPKSQTQRKPKRKGSGTAPALPCPAFLFPSPSPLYIPSSLSPPHPPFSPLLPPVGSDAAPESVAPSLVVELPESPFYDPLDTYADFDESTQQLWEYVEEGGWLRPLLQALGNVASMAAAEVRWVSRIWLYIRCFLFLAMLASSEQCRKA